MRPSTVLNTHRHAIRALVAAHRAANVRVFGSASRGDDTASSDLDLLVDPLPGATLLDLGGLQVALEELLGCPVDVVTAGGLPPTLRDSILRQARPV